MAKLSKSTRQSVRIIGGQWRGRRLAFPVIEGLRPTPDRIRETLFNWLQAYLPGAVCIDLFSGSGALGFEAASRGAEKVDMVELDLQAYKQLQANKTMLAAEQCTLFRQPAQQFLNQASKPYDIVFLDPPFDANLWNEMADLLTRNNLLHPKSLVYLECNKYHNLEQFPDNWHLIKDKQAGDVRYCLFAMQ
ncbi:16S rRNA (guanine(966)-N(2))-methyltransferase RsmD [Methylophaga pinxianii]|uniref:16S rRNA (guanine(966)-N(2))-methyltransferase RsmD n=1 Tax=Methylophaga pinxianii TaxID=2881052 RepID=UPI001CF4ACE3|nr:16S rRNA (guanine(966)-N(2))-methyltransferase RsmD [Methylophaga pinxianii]MCB2428306.1 16S rRNA (guanine(966)-N(2))-methyltransferase RsmD [Methylophaga pinxianii]UPH45243.1 16S rRNA (guanine(966)-N(2))-methyltransferase RsmD [Methylophaga pinxianii]